MKSKTTTYKFKKGEVIQLDHIYEIQGLAGGDWWTRQDDMDEELTVTRDIEIKIIVKE